MLTSYWNEKKYSILSIINRFVIIISIFLKLPINNRFISVFPLFRWLVSLYRGGIGLLSGVFVADENKILWSSAREYPSTTQLVNKQVDLIVTLHSSFQ